MAQTHYYIHIPKTGGTAMKYALAEQNNKSVDVKIQLPQGGHNQHLQNMKQNVCFIIRHPWDRFCSGFWERATMPERREKSRTEYRDVPSFGYKDYNGLEKEILAECKHPDQFLTYIREGGKVQPGSTPGLFELTAGLGQWLGSIETYKRNESKIKMVYHINNVDHVMKSIYNIDMPTDPFKKRSRALFDKKQSYHISPRNRIWFEQEYRKADYELIAYIKTRPYWYAP